MTNGIRIRIGGLASWAVAALSGIVAFRKLDDFDTWWHLAAGRWIAGHGAAPSTDTLSHTVRDHPWIDLQWGFDLALYFAHKAGGPALLCVGAAIGFALAIVLVLRLTRPHLGDVLGSCLAFLVIVAAQDRFAIRPELLSFPLLLVLISILDHGLKRGGRGLWLLVPLMVVWVNVHALFVIGAFAIVCALIGAPSLPSRKLAVSGGLALAAVVINPYGFRGALFPLKLLTRIDGSSPAFQTIAEFRSPFAADAAGASIVAYKLLLIAGSVAAIAALIVNLRRRAGIDLGGLVFFAGLAALSVMARRNAALFAFGCAPFIARSFGTVFAALPARVRDRSRTCAPYGAAVVICAAILAAASVVTGAFYRWDHQSREFGSGVIEGTFPVRAAAFVREAKLPPNLYNDIASGGYLAWDDPLGNGVFIDGRLEVYDTEFFSEYIAAMYDQDRWYADADRFGVQTVILYHHWENRRLLLERLVRGGVFWLVYADEVAAVFVRAAGNEQALARAAAMNDRWNRATRDWLERPFAKRPYPAGRVEGTRSFAGLLATVGDPKGAEEAYLKLLELGVTAGEEIETRLLLARRFAATGRIEQARDQARRILTIDPSNQEAQGLLR